MSCGRDSHRPEVVTFLPEAPAAAYLRWTAWRGWAQRRFLSNLRTAGQLEAIRRFHGPMTLVWALLSQTIREQARDARKAGLRFVAPRVSADEELLGLALAYHDRGRGWLAPLGNGSGGIHGTAEPAAEVLILEESVLAAIRRQMVLSGAGRLVLPPPESRSALPIAS